MLNAKPPSLRTEAVWIAPLARLVARITAPPSVVPADAATSETPLTGGSASMRLTSGTGGAVRSTTMVRLTATGSPWPNARAVTTTLPSGTAVSGSVTVYGALASVTATSAGFDAGPIENSTRSIGSDGVALTTTLE